MHGLIFETSVCYWQDQPDFYSSIPHGASRGRRVPTGLHRSAEHPRKKTSQCRSWKRRTSWIGCSLVLRQSRKSSERATSKWISDCSGYTGGPRRAGSSGPTGPVPPLKRGTTGRHLRPKGTHAVASTRELHPFPEALFDSFRRRPRVTRTDRGSTYAQLNEATSP